MKRPLRIMLILIGSMAVVIAAAVGVYLYLQHGKGKHPAPLSAAQIKALQVDLPQLTTNLENNGLIQFTVTLQANDAATKKEISDLQPEIQDAINSTMRGFTSSDLGNAQGYTALKTAILTAVNHVLPKGQVSAVYLSQVVVQ